MSEQIFSNIEPIDDSEINTEPEKKEEVVSHDNNDKPKKEEIKSNKYTDIKLLVESRYGRSRVFMAKSPSGTVILKALKEKYANDAQSKSFLKSEFDITNMLDSRYIRKALAYENVEGLGQCIVFEYINGKTLWEHVRLGTVSERQVKNILIEICDALTYMHRNGVIHCDLRPENIIITEDCHVKIIDIGLPETEYETNKEILVKEMEFIAPELIKGEEGDARSDVYSVGKIMEFMCARNIMKDSIEVATPCTQYSKEQRYESAAELKSALTTGGSPKKLVVVILVLLLLAAIGFGLFKVFSKKMENEDRMREEAAFAAAITEMKNNIPMLCEKYSIKDMTEPLRVDWAEDSMRLAQKVNSLDLTQEMKDKEIQALQEVGNAIYQSRKNNFDKMLLAEYDKAQDSVAMNLKKNIPNPTPEQVNQNANTWFNTFVKGNDQK